MTAHEDPPHIDHMGPSSGIQSLNAPPESSMLSEILNVRAWWVVGMCAMHCLLKRKTLEACDVYWAGQSLTKQGVGGNQKRSARRMRKNAEIKEVKEMARLSSVPLDLNWAASEGAITCVPLTAHSH